jgi:hypothetical protein
MSETATSRRALLAAAAASAAAVTAAQFARPLPAAAADPNDLVLNTINNTNSLTGILQASNATAFSAQATSAPNHPAIDARSNNHVAVLGHSDTNKKVGVAGIAGASNPTGNDLNNTNDMDAGVYGYCSETADSSGVWGHSTTGFGVLGNGPTGVSGQSFDTNGLGGYFSGTHGVMIVVDKAATGVGLHATGAIKFPDRAKRIQVLAGKRSRTVSWPGVTSSRIAIGTINTNRSGRYVQSVVCGAGTVTVNLNGTVPGATWVSVLILG